MSRTADYDSVEPLPQKALDQRVSYFLGLFVTGLLAVGVVAGVVGGIQYFNAEVVGVGKGATGAPGSDIVTALPPTLSPTALLTAVATALSNVSLPRGPPGFNATCTCPLVRNGTDSTVPGPAGPQGPQGIMGPVYYSNGTAPSTFSHITVVAGGTWTGGPVFDDVTITHNLTVYNAMSAKLLIAGSSGQFKVDATGAVQAAGFFAGNSTIFTTSTVYGGVLSLSGTAQNSLQTQGGIQAVNNIASTTGSVTTAAASMSSTGVFTGTTAQIAGDVNGKRGVFATDIIVGGGVFSVNSTGAVTARSLQTVGTISTPLASLDAAGTVKGVTVWTPLASINAAGMINGTAVFSSSTIATPLASMNAAGLINGTAVWTPLASLNAAGLVNGTAIWTPLASMNAAGLVNGTAVWTPLASMNSAGVVNGTNVVGLQSVSTPLLDMSATSGSMIKQVSAISFNATAAIIDMHGVGNILGVAILNATAVNAPNINVLNGAITNVHSISGDSSGTVSISGKLQANGLFTASAGALVSGTMTANSLAVNGGTLNGGPGSLSTPGDVSISGFLIVTNAITANGGVTVPGDADITYTSPLAVPFVHSSARLLPGPEPLVERARSHVALERLLPPATEPALDASDCRLVPRIGVHVLDESGAVGAVEGGEIRERGRDRGEQVTVGTVEGGEVHERGRDRGEQTTVVAVEGGEVHERRRDRGEQRTVGAVEGGEVHERERDRGEQRTVGAVEGGEVHERRRDRGENIAVGAVEGGEIRERGRDRGENIAVVAVEGGEIRERGRDRGEQRTVVAVEGGEIRERGRDRGEQRTVGAVEGGEVHEGFDRLRADATHGVGKEESASGGV